jgi:hypothetical protein
VTINPLAFRLSSREHKSKTRSRATTDRGSFGSIVQGLRLLPHGHQNQ